MQQAQPWCVDGRHLRGILRLLPRGATTDYQYGQRSLQLGARVPGSHPIFHLPVSRHIGVSARYVAATSFTPAFDHVFTHLCLGRSRGSGSNWLPFGWVVNTLIVAESHIKTGRGVLD